MAQGTLGLVVGRRQVRVPDEGDDRVPVVEDFAGQFADLLLELVAVALAVPLDARHQPLDGSSVAALSVVDPLDEAAQVADQVTTEAGTGAVIALGERQALADEMRQATLPAGMITVSEIAVGDQPTQERLADQRGQFLLGSRLPMWKTVVVAVTSTHIQRRSPF